MYELIYLLAGGTTAVIALVAIWAARSTIHWFWRGAALLSCFALLVPIGAAELNLLFAPMAGLLILASLAQRWWERRKKRLTGGDAPSPRKTKIRFSLRELFLVILLAAAAAWVVAPVMQERILLDWRKLPIAVVLVTIVARIAATWVDKPRRWQPFWARAAAYLSGLGMMAASINALIYVLKWESATDITIAAACIVCLTMMVTYSWLVYVGRMPQTVLLAVVIYFAAFVHANYMGDWLSADYLLIEQMPPVWFVRQIVYGMLYFHFAIFVLLGAVLGRGLALPTRQSWRNLVLSRVSMTALALASLSLVWIYWQLLETPSFVSRTTASTTNSLPDANQILLKLEEAQKFAGQTAPAAGSGPTLPDTPEMRRLTQRFFTALEKPGSVSRQWDTPEQEAAIEGQVAEARRLLEIAMVLLGKNDNEGDHDEKSRYWLAKVRYATYSERGALVVEAWHAFFMEESGHLQLAMIHDELSLPCRRDLLRALRELDRMREPLDVLLAREATWSEQHEHWRIRLNRVVLGKETRAVDAIFQLVTVRQAHDECVAIARLNMTNMAIRLFRDEKGRLPSNLQELVPRYLDAIPTDPYSGLSLVYRPSGGSYVLYSIGPDKKDDGGRRLAVAGPYWYHSQVGDLVLEAIIRDLHEAAAKGKAAAAKAAAKALPAAQSGGKSPIDSDR